MILYHGSTDLVYKPEIRKSDVYLDFGVGFYTTTSLEQAERWAKIKMRRKNVDLGYVAIYEFDIEKAEKELTIKRFEKADMHIGPVADDNVYQSIRLFETGAYDAEYTVTKLKTEVLHDQWTLHSNEILKYLNFIEAKEVR